MDEHSLPDDLSRWPSDPFQLLGVRRGVSERDLRRAYAALIRIYKPEQFPEHFRRIREAYEWAKDHSYYYAVSEENPTEHISTTARAATSASEPVSQRSFTDEFEEAWNWVGIGDEARAYACLLDLWNRYPQRAEIGIRLFFLLDAAPELDPHRSPCDFLVQCLRNSNGSGPCHELYRREVERRPEEALTDRFASLLKDPLPAAMVSIFAQWRWTAAGRLARLEVIGNDVPVLRARLAFENEQIWLQLLASAADQLAWAPGYSQIAFGISDCLAEIAQHKHLELICSGVFDRLEYLERMATGWRTLRFIATVPTELLDLLAAFWTRHLAAIRRPLTSLLAQIVADPYLWMRHFSVVQKNSPELLALFGNVLNAYESELELEEDERDSHDLQLLATSFLEEHGTELMATFRTSTLAFCLRELIHPDVLAEIAASQLVAISHTHIAQMASDWPLRHVYRACVLFSS